MATPRSLSNRLRQHSRRSGFAVGASMALAIAVCIAGFVTIYVQLQPYISDFVTQDPPEEEARAAVPVATERPPAPSDEEEPEPTEELEDEVEEPVDDVPNEEEPAPTEESDEFTPDRQVGTETGSAIRLRSEASTSGGDATVLDLLAPATAIQTTGETQAADDPASDGNVWIQVRTMDGLEGWIREIDTEPFEE